MDDMERCSGGGGVGDQFLHGVDCARLDGSAVAHVDEDGHMAGGGELKDLEDLGAGSGGDVGDAQADAEAALVEAFGDQVEGLFAFGPGWRLW